MFTPCRYLVHSILLFSSIVNKLAHTWGSGGWGVFVSHPSVLSGWWTEHPSLECSLLPVQVPSSEFLQDFWKEVQCPQWYSRVTQSVWSSLMVGVFDHLLPTSKADIWSLWVGRCLHTLVTCIAEIKSDPRWGRYLAKFRSYEGWNIWRGWNRWHPIRMEFGLIWTP